MLLTLVGVALVDVALMDVALVGVAATARRRLEPGNLLDLLLLHFHVARALEFTTVFQRDARGYHVPPDHARAAYDHLLVAVYIALQLAFDLDRPGAYVRLDPAFLAD